MFPITSKAKFGEKGGISPKNGEVFPINSMNNAKIYPKTGKIGVSLLPHLLPNLLPKP